MYISCPKSRYFTLFNVGLCSADSVVVYCLLSIHVLGDSRPGEGAVEVHTSYWKTSDPFVGIDELTATSHSANVLVKLSPTLT